MRPPISLATVLGLLFASTLSAQTPTPAAGPDTPAFRIQIWGYMEADFATLVSSYFELRTSLQRGLPGLTVTADPAEIQTAERALARRIRAARAGAQQGEFFTPPISVTFKEALTIELDDSTMAAIMDEGNPGEVQHPINGTYPKNKPYATMPYRVLAALPSLPADLQYRFLGHHLILIDTRANVILDRIPCAIECSPR